MSAEDAGSAQAHAPSVMAPILHLDGFDGPMDLLLELARAQKVDLARISILQLVEQYLAVVDSVRNLRLELAADWLVMAAWLAWLKSRLLLPAHDEDALDAEEAAGALQARLVELERVGLLARWLAAQPCLGHDVFERGEAEDLVEIDRSGLAVDIAQLMRGYMTAMRRHARKRAYRPRQFHFWTVQDALRRLRDLLGADMVPDWCSLDAFLPDVGETGRMDAAREDERRAQRRAAVAGTLLASLEMAKSGVIELRQDEEFGRIELRRNPQAETVETGVQTA
ncbi:segregation and condensation protein A [Novacetimonas maltaceti]|uniref:Segregation and condensation protein A n=1 Tax=Novacetimonas maltaceti TaxID=1203393 RepID=A0A2S3W1B8_9PROT|nr:ScpA family protein [Novacetimonas maltaceti]POF62675.1 segregation and condensation protein A [Novacetimonas maltaceti]